MFFPSNDNPNTHQQHGSTTTPLPSSLVLSKDRDLYNKAKELIVGGTTKTDEDNINNTNSHKTTIAKFVTSWYSERKLATFMLNYFSILVVVFTHFALTTGNKDWEIQMYYLKDASPGIRWFVSRFALLEAGGVNANLAMIVGLPLTMCHLTISYLSNSNGLLSTFIPFRRLQRVHITLGYLMYWTFTVLLIAFIPFILLLSNQVGSRPGNLAFNNQMFITGYFIYASMLAMVITSALRHKIRYEVFYYTHQLSLFLFVLWILHTLGKYRDMLNQCYPWVTPPFLYYISDRLCMKFFHKNSTPLMEATMIDEATDNNIIDNNDNGKVTNDSRRGEKAMILRIQRPTLFDFEAGQYAYIKCSAIDNHWHPFSIMSDPDNTETLDFFVGVVGKESRSWSDRLFTFINEYQQQSSNKSFGSINQQPPIMFEVQGPYGSRLGDTEKHSHLISIGSGTGIVPVLSLLQNHIGRLLRLDPDRHITSLTENCDKIIRYEEARYVYKGSVGAKLVSGLRLRKRNTTTTSHTETTTTTTSVDIHDGDTSVDNETSSSSASLIKMERAATAASRGIYGKVLLSFMPMAGIALIGFTLSWNTTPTPIEFVPWSYPAMRHTAMVLTCVYQAAFALVALLIWNTNSFAVFLDFWLVVITPFADWLWFDRLIRFGKLETTDMILYTLLMGYFVFRSWYSVVKPRKGSWRTATKIAGVDTLQRMDAIWIVRSPVVASQLLPEIENQYKLLVDKWGIARANQVCKIKIFVTSKDEYDQQFMALLTKKELSNSWLVKAGCIEFGQRPDLSKLLQEHTLDVMSQQTHSYTLLSFCGSQKVSSELQKLKVQNDMIKSLLPFGTNHQMEYESECRAGAGKKKKDNDSISTNITSSTTSHQQEVTLMKRKTISLMSSDVTMITAAKNYQHGGAVLENDDDDDDECLLSSQSGCTTSEGTE